MSEASGQEGPRAGPARAPLHQRGVQDRASSFPTQTPAHFKSASDGLPGGLESHIARSPVYAWTPKCLFRPRIFTEPSPLTKSPGPSLCVFLRDLCDFGDLIIITSKPALLCPHLCGWHTTPIHSGQQQKGDPSCILGPHTATKLGLCNVPGTVLSSVHCLHPGGHLYGLLVDPCISSRPQSLGHPRPHHRLCPHRVTLTGDHH